METQADTVAKLITYYVNDARLESAEHKVTVRTILTSAKLTPPEDYELERNAGGKVFKDLNEEVELHEGERFTAVFVGPTPTS